MIFTGHSNILNGAIFKQELIDHQGNVLLRNGLNQTLKKIIEQSNGIRKEKTHLAEDETECGLIGMGFVNRSQQLQNRIEKESNTSVKKTSLSILLQETILMTSART